MRRWLLRPRFVAALVVGRVLPHEAQMARGGMPGSLGRLSDAICMHGRGPAR